MSEYEQLREEFYKYLELQEEERDIKNEIEAHKKLVSMIANREDFRVIHNEEEFNDAVKYNNELRNALDERRAAEKRLNEIRNEIRSQEIRVSGLIPLQGVWIKIGGHMVKDIFRGIAIRDWDYMYDNNIW